MERDNRFMGIRFGNADFNSHAHVERDVRTNKLIGTIINFNSHAHVERDSGRPNNSQTNAHFNSHAHVERDLMSVKSVGGHSISTHTLTWSVTTSGGRVSETQQISTHTLTWSVTILR